MGLPAKRRTKQSKRERAAHFALVEANLTTCSHCKRKILPHRVCPYCGYYRGREVLKLEQLITKKAKKRSEKAAKKEKAREDKSE